MRNSENIMPPPVNAVAFSMCSVQFATDKCYMYTLIYVKFFVVVSLPYVCTYSVPMLLLKPFAISSKGQMRGGFAETAIRLVGHDPDQ